MVLGISSYTYGWNIGLRDHMPPTPMNESDLVKLTLDFKLKCLQIGDNLPLHTFDSSRKERFKKLIQDNGIRLEIGARKLDPENLKQYIAIARYFESPLLRFIIDGEGYEPDNQTVIKTIQLYLTALADNNIILGIENHDRLKAAGLAEIMQAIDHPSVGICLDCVNSMGAGEGLNEVAHILSPYTVNLHIKDFTAKRLPHKMGFIIEGEIAGRGMLDLGHLLEKIKPFNRCSSAVLEQWVPPETEQEQTLEKERDWARKSIDYLQSYFNQKTKQEK